MAAKEELASRIRKVLAKQRGVTEQAMFGGICFMIRGHMCCGTLKQNLVVRLGPERYEHALAKPHVRPMNFTGRPLRGFVFVGPQGTHTQRALAYWIEQGIAYVQTLPAKPKLKKRARSSAK